ncbi:polysaccharide export protein [bacterium]|nr:polysaccharide export protein [bacterium]
MFTKSSLIVLLVSALLLASTAPFFAGEKMSYTIGPADVLEISVWQHPELDRTVTVRPDGKISFSLIGDVDTTGLTPAELDEVVTQRLSQYVQNPEVTVIVTDIKSGQIIVLGQVARSGAYPMGESSTVLEAIAEAGGYTERAALGSVTITRKSEANNPKVIKVNLKKVIVEGDRNKNAILEPGDVVYLPEKKSAWDIFDRYFIRGILPITGFILMIDRLTEK